jgi:hypothetical protein
MIEKHIVELLIEANKDLSAIIDKLEMENPPFKDRQVVIDQTNSVIRQLDSIVEKLES